MDIASIATTLPRAKSRFCPVKAALDDAQAALGFSKVPLGAVSTPQHQAHTHRNMMRSGVFEWKTKEKRRIKEAVLYFFCKFAKKEKTHRARHPLASDGTQMAGDKNLCGYAATKAGTHACDNDSRQLKGKAATHATCQRQ